MAQNETEQAGLPMLTGVAPGRPSLSRNQNMAAFVSQLIAERARLAPQRERRRATPEGAIDAYASGASIAVKRMPAGYRTTVVV